MNKMLSYNDICRLAGRTKMIKFADLNKYSSIDELLPDYFDSIIIFFETMNANTGHWTCLTKTLDKYYTFFDSYGNEDHKDYNYIPNKQKTDLNISTDYLANLLKNCKVEHNHTDYQGRNSNTCGRWVAVYLYFFKHGRTLNQFHEKMAKAAKNFHSFDEMVVYFT